MCVSQAPGVFLCTNGDLCVEGPVVENLPERCVGFPCTNGDVCVCAGSCGRKPVQTMWGFSV